MPPPRTMLRKKAVYIVNERIFNCSSRQLAIDLLHSHSDVITLNPLVLNHDSITAPQDAPANEYYMTWYKITKRIQVVPYTGDFGCSTFTFNASFHNVPWGLETHIYGGPFNIDLRNKYRIGGHLPGESANSSEVFLDVEALSQPEACLYLHQEVEVSYGIGLHGFVKHFKAASEKLALRFVQHPSLQSPPQYAHATISHNLPASPGRTRSVPRPIELPGDHEHNRYQYYQSHSALRFRETRHRWPNWSRSDLSASSGSRSLQTQSNFTVSNSQRRRRSDSTPISYLEGHLSFDRTQPVVTTEQSLHNRIPEQFGSHEDDEYAFLCKIDTVFLIDDSISMTNGRNWTEVMAVLSNITHICTSRDPDGIDLYFLNHRSSQLGVAGKADGGYYNIKDPIVVNNIFKGVQPSDETPTGQRLRSILKPYFAELSRAEDVDNVKPINIIVVTDGKPTDFPDDVIVQHARKLDNLEAPPYQVGIQFFQVGNDPEAGEALRVLDDDLPQQGVRDIVDTVTWDRGEDTLTAEGVLKVVLGAVARRLDRRQSTCT